MEEALRREVWEESGIKVGKVEIISSQPWPIGRGGGCELMIGCLGYATTTEVTIQDPEVKGIIAGCFFVYTLNLFLFLSYSHVLGRNRAMVLPC